MSGCKKAMKVLTLLSSAGALLLQVPERACATMADAMQHPLLFTAAERGAFSGSEIVGLTAWCIAARTEGGGAGALANAIKGRGANSPLLWPQDEAERLLKVPVLPPVSNFAIQPFRAALCMFAIGATIGATDDSFLLGRALPHL